MKFQAQRGTEDILPEQAAGWQFLESRWSDIVGLYGYEELRSPMFEDTELFLRTAGETSDIVSKEMYTFTDKGDRSITLKPEGTAGAMRAVLEHSLCPPGTILRLFYITPIFRYGRPGKGRLRQSHQLGLELIGSAMPAADAEVIELTYRFFRSVGISNFSLKVNSIGKLECRSRYCQAILDHLEPFLVVCDTETSAKIAKNPLGTLDTKDVGLRAALEGVPSIHDFLEEDSRAHFESVQAYLFECGVAFQLDPMIVRGLDYYNDIVFEVTSDEVGEGLSLCGGGRYDGLVQTIGGPRVPSVGVGIGMERTLMALDQMGLVPRAEGMDVAVISAGAETAGAARSIVRELRLGGLRVAYDIDERSMKSQLRQADKSGAKLAVIVGSDELARGCVQVRDLGRATQQELPVDGLTVRLKDALTQ